MRYLFVFRHPPYGGSRGSESLDLLLTLAAFDQEVEVLLLDDGVAHLLPGQAPAVTGQRNLATLWQNLALYGVEAAPWVERESLERWEVAADALLVPVRMLERSRLGQFWRNYDVILGD